MLVCMKCDSESSNHCHECVSLVIVVVLVMWYFQHRFITLSIVVFVMKGCIDKFNPGVAVFLLSISLGTHSYIINQLQQPLPQIHMHGRHVFSAKFGLIGIGGAYIVT